MRPVPEAGDRLLSGDMQLSAPLLNTASKYGERAARIARWQRKGCCVLPSALPSQGGAIASSVASAYFGESSRLATKDISPAASCKATCKQAGHARS